MRESTRYRGVYARRDVKNRPRYQIEYKGSDGRRRFLTLPLGTTAKEASQHRSSLVTRLARGERIAPTRVTVKTLWDEWIATQTSLEPNTVKKYQDSMRLYVLPSFGHRKVADIDVNLVALLVSELVGKGYKAWTVRAALSPLSRLMSHAARRGLVGQNPVKLLDKSERPKSDAAVTRILSSEEIGRLLGASSEAFTPILTTALFTGLRISEILSLRWEDVDFQTGVIRVRKSKTASGVREVVMVGVVEKVLAGLSLESDQPQVFQWGGRNLRRVHTETLKRAGIPHLRFHDLRHTFASILISQKHDVAFIAEQMGHASITTTYRVYGKLFDSTDKKTRMREAFAESFGGVA